MGIRKRFWLQPLRPLQPWEQDTLPPAGIWLIRILLAVSIATLLAVIATL